ncbi:hypothetical protein Goe27_01500 [Bacillus phage vB_BsuM-Goe27]|uniref:Uncharacterized protein n=1 Tax=Bacillus phage vB_BsuM-Goe3 TaxID=1933063 RepID=A0A217ER89_BPGO3|nr:hypothetical protein HWB07_gp160 [Bacillus phage vB_BsuM-Goe3]QDP43176.1 hypothetical protein Goe7_c01510 [Bacillus phage vB_BveM-Goe7]WCS69013.1 hypothetical protein Goe17_01540 [Bacillus phage vB_BsuM-Goe17]WCS69526.1 hypothetical protein Goe24_01510 [Bacillus phage vB_BsuM-Goe24]WCS69781.1 hypothetical protein Goe25_01530 [Bacillus phage vB_BsuM-Goe25]WCS70028.1 hypothetical protein Goe27_01500 [Bacillus phage vB_BsuM-Goe27]
MSPLEIQDRMKKEKLMSRLQQMITKEDTPEGYIPFLQRRVEKLKLELEGL